MERLEEICLSLPAGSSDVTAEMIGAELEQEMKRMDEAIQKAVDLIEEMQKKSRATDSGIRLAICCFMTLRLSINSLLFH